MIFSPSYVSKYVSKNDMNIAEIYIDKFSKFGDEIDRKNRIGFVKAISFEFPWND